MKAVTCLSCGLVSDAPHETHEACIEALQAEISRTRHILATVTEPLRPPALAVEEDSKAS